MFPFGLDLNLLVALDALLEFQSVTRAADKLSVSQPAMSGSLSRLREYFDDPILVPVGRRLEKTPLAEELTRSLPGLLVHLEVVLRTRPGFDPASAHRCFKVMASEYGSVVVVAEAMRRISGIAPQVSAEVTPFVDFPALALEEGDMDLLVIRRQSVAADHPFESLFVDSSVCVAWSDNTLVRDGMDLAEFLSLGHVVVKYGRGSTPHIDEAFLSAAGSRRRAEITVSSYSAVPQYVVRSRRVAVLPKRLAEIYAQSAPLKILPVPADLPPLEMCLQWNSRRESDPSVVWFRDQLKAASSEHPPAPGM
jgi:LysR family nod box-dependent transcriptional activator